MIFFVKWGDRGEEVEILDVGLVCGLGGVRMCRWRKNVQWIEQRRGNPRGCPGESMMKENIVKGKHVKGRLLGGRPHGSPARVICSHKNYLQKQAFARLAMLVIASKNEICGWPTELKRYK